MRLSDLTTDRAAEVLCEIAPCIASITGDKALLDTLRDAIPRGATAAEICATGARKVSEIIPVLLRDHRNDLFTLLAVLNETSAESIAVQNVLVTIKQCRDLFADKDLLAFFKSCQQEEGTP